MSELTTGTTDLPQEDKKPAPPKTQMYLLDHGFVFCLRNVRSETIRFTAGLVLALEDPFEIGIDGHMEETDVAAMRPLLKRCLQVDQRPIISIGLTADHPQYRSFCAIGAPGYVGLPRQAFSPHHREMAQLYRGELSLDQAHQLTDVLARTSAALLPPPKPLDPRVQHALTLLRRNSHHPLNELAAAVGLSYDRMSHLFSENMGMPLRSYLLSQKIQAAAQMVGSGHNLTEVAHAAGFSDSSHFSRAWHMAFGTSPSFFYASDHVNIQLRKTGSQEC